MRIGKVTIGPRRAAALVALATVVLAPAAVLVGAPVWVVVTVAAGVVALLVAAAVLADLGRILATGQRPPDGVSRQLVRMQRRAVLRGLRLVLRRVGVRPERLEARSAVLRRLAGYLRDDDPAELASRKRQQEVRSVSRALWMGFSIDAVADLERIRRSGEEPAPVARAAETLARWYTTEGRYEQALDRLIHARDIDQYRHATRFRVLEHHLLTRLGLFEEADRLFEQWGAGSADLRLVQANLRLHQAQAGLLARDEADRQRIALIDWAFHQHSLTPISQLIDSAAPLEFSSLRGAAAFATGAAGSSGKPPTVSVVVPAYNAESTIATSVNSLRAQTVTDIEILVVDDASTDNTNAVAKALAADDPRVRVIQHELNQGAYSARNTGLANASGEYFTVHDADDWSHPQMLERQLRAIREPGAVASFSRLARISPQFEFLLRPYRPMLEPIHWNYTSLLTTTRIMRDLGGWDTVRVHADSELIERMGEHFGRSALVEADPEVPLSFFLVTGGNLTESKDTSLRSVDFGARKEYSSQARHWRRQTFGEGELPSYREHRRTDAKSPFFCPRALATNRDRISEAYDLVLGSDLSLLGGTRRCNLAYIDCARRLGLRVGIVNLPRYRSRNSGGIDSTYRELFQLPDVDLVTPDAAVTARALLVHHPPVLRNAFDACPTVHADRRYLLVNQLPWQMKGFQEAQYDTAAVHRRYAELFGDDPVWISISRKVRRNLAEHLPPDALLDEDWCPIVGDTAATPRVRAHRTAAKPVVGRHSRDHGTKWPESAEALAQSYLADTDYEVRLLGGTTAAEEVLGRRPRNWQVHPFDSIGVDEFLRDVDIFVHFHHSMYIEEFGRNIAEAMAVGVPCVLPTEHAETFGDAAVYAEPDQVADTVRRLWSDHEMYNDYSARGIAFVAENCGWDAGTRRIASLFQ